MEESSKAWFNPLNQFAEITLQKSHQEMLLAQYLHRLQGLELTPSNSPSPPPPAHMISPSLQHRLQQTKPPLALNNFGFLPPPQTAPEDLRVVARKIDFPALKQSADSTAGEDLLEDFEESLPNDKGHHECPDCGKAYSTSSNLARHRQTHR